MVTTGMELCTSSMTSGSPNPVPCRGYSYTAQGRFHFPDSAVRIEKQRVDTHRTVLVKLWGVIIMVIEEVPLTVVFRDGMMIGPATDGRFVHDDALEGKRSHRAVSHSIRQCFSLVLYPRERKVILVLALEYVRSLLESVR